MKNSRTARVLFLQVIASVLVLGGYPAPASAAPVGNIYSTGNLNIPIPDASVLPLTIPVDVGATVLDVNVHIRASHTFMNDLTMYLESPDRAVANLATLNGGGEGSYGSGSEDCNGNLTVLDDEAATSINDGSSPFAGSFKPETPPLSVFDGKRSDGDWRLLVFDTGDVDTGRIFCWQMQLTLDLCPGFEAVVANHIVGTSGSDDLTGTVSKDVMCGGDGNDQIHGRQANDILDGGNGRDHVVAGRGRDRLIGGPGKDFCDGGPHKDSLRGCETAVR